MHETSLISTSSQLPDLPDNIPDLLAWDKYLSARMPVYRRLLKGVTTLEEAAAEEDRIRKRATLESEYLIDVRVKIGKMIQDIPKATPNNNPYHQNDNNVDLVKPKSETLSEYGISQKQAERYQQMASHPEAVEAAKANARERNDVVSQQSVLRIIAADTPSPPTTKQKEREKVLEAKERHADYRQKKSEGVVDINDAMQDKEDRKTIAEELYKDLRSWTAKGGWIGALNNSETFNSLVSVIPKEDAKKMADRIMDCITVMTKLMEVLNGR